MPYIKQTWVDLPSHATPLSAERLSYIEDGIEAATELAEAIASPIATDVDFTPTGSVSSTNVQAAIMEVVADFNAALSSIDLSSKVSKSGDTMSGPLTITTDDDLHPIQVWKDEAGVVRAMMLADASTQTPSEGTPRFFMPMANQVAGGAAVTERAFELFTSDDEWAVDIDADGTIALWGSGSYSNKVFRFTADGESQERFIIDGAGEVRWGDGAGQFIELYRVSATELKIDDYGSGALGKLILGDATAATHALNRQTADARYASSSTVSTLSTKNNAIAMAIALG